MEDIEYDTPPYISKNVSGKKVLTVSWDIIGLLKTKTKTKCKCHCMIEGKNANILPTFDARSMCITVDGTSGRMEGKHYQLRIKKLPGEIDAKSCSLSVENDRIVIELVKVEEKVWYVDDGLEYFSEEEEN